MGIQRRQQSSVFVESQFFCFQKNWHLLQKHKKNIKFNISQSKTYFRDIYKE